MTPLNRRKPNRSCSPLKNTMKDKIKICLTALVLLATVIVSMGQTVFPQPNSNVYLDGSHILVGSIPSTVLGTNAPGSGGQVLFTDGVNIYWGNPVSSGGTVNNFTISNLTAYFINNVSNQYVTNVTIFDSLTVNTNVTVLQNFSVSGKATLNNIIVTNNLSFSTNAYSIGAGGTTFDLSKPYQELQTNASFNVTALAGLSNNLVNWGVLQVSNSGASSITMGFTVSGAIAIGTSTTNSLIIPSTKMAVLSVNAWGNKRVTYVTAAGQ